METDMIRVETGQLDEATRAALTSGRADAAVALFLDSVIAMRGLSDLTGDALAGQALERETPAAMARDALAQVFAKIHAAPQQAAKKTSRLGEMIHIPPALHAVVADAEQKRGWKIAAPGVRMLPLDVSTAVKAEIIRLAPGASVARHTHKGRELTLCLVGGFSDHRGSYGPGDVSPADPSVHHQPKADDDGVCYVLAITDAGLTFEGALGAIQKLFRG
jgi:putative transcriptional regulator